MAPSANQNSIGYVHVIHAELQHVFVCLSFKTLSCVLPPSSQVRQYAAYALVKVGQNSDVRKQVTEEGGLEPVLYLARTEEPEIQRETLACLCSLSFSEENKINITKYGGLPPIMSAIRSPDVQTARMACCACANLCEVVGNMDNIVDAGGIPALVQVRV